MNGTIESIDRQIFWQPPYCRWCTNLARFCGYQYLILFFYSFFVFHFIGSSSKQPSDRFFHEFVCDYLAKHAEARYLLKLKEDGLRLLRFNNIDKITWIYCDYKEKYHSRILSRDFKKRKDNFKNIIAPLEKEGSLKKVGNGTEFGKEYLKYEIKKNELWHLLTRNYSVQRKSNKVIRTFTLKIFL